MYVVFLTSPLAPAIADVVGLQYLGTGTQSSTELGSSLSPALAALLLHSSTLVPVSDESVELTVEIDAISALYSCVFVNVVYFICNMQLWFDSNLRHNSLIFQAHSPGKVVMGSLILSMTTPVSPWHQDTVSLASRPAFFSSRCLVEI